ncbi:MAG: glutamate/gamma-aminobutyrate family transporter YjeM [Streptococcaceae bacterium]|nr:glutamate/gamma-aminobutyrate family transporter YjeM [Streptococcaceae bacterium]
MMAKTKGKLSLIALSLMIFTSVYGFNNIPRAFFKMGYGAIPWYVIGGLLFFLPFAFMVTELGSAFKEEKGGIYSWMDRAVGPRFAFIGTFMWYASYLVWMVSVSNTILVPLTNLIFGTTNLPSTTIISIIAIIFMAMVTFMSLRGLDAVKKFASVGGVAVLSLNVILILGALIVLISKGFTPATPINLAALVSSPNPNFTPSLVSFVAFMVYAIFAYGGVESVGGLVDQTENPEKNFPRGIITSALIITVGYSLAILTVGFFVDYKGDWAASVADQSINLGNVGYVMMTELGEKVGGALGLSHGASSVLGQFFARYTGFSMFAAYMGAFFTLIYSPIKQIIVGTPEKLWPKNLGKIEDDIPKRAMKAQFLIVVIIILLNMGISMVNEGAAGTFFEVLTNMTNVSMTLPYIFIIIAYYRFKNNEAIEKPFVIFKSIGLAKLVTFVVIAVIGFANLFTVIQPIVDFVSLPVADQTSALLSSTITSVVSMVVGPIIFGSIAFALMNNYLKTHKNA